MNLSILLIFSKNNCMWWFCVYFIIFYPRFYYLLLLTGFEICSLFFQRFIITSFVWDLLFCKLSTYFSNFPLSTALAVSIPMTCCALIFHLIQAIFSFAMISSMTPYLFKNIFCSQTIWAIFKVSLAVDFYFCLTVIC